MSETAATREQGSPAVEPQDAPVVSVLIPAYNAARYIGETLDSVLAQTFKEYEIVVVNDGSPDTPELERALAPYRSRIVYLTQENGGPGRARNTAIEASRGRYIALLDADDLWEPEYLSVQVAALERDPSLDVVYSNGRIFGDGADVGREMMEAFPSQGEVTFESVVRGRCTVLICAVMRRETVVGVGMFDQTFRGVEDFELWLRILGRGGRISYHRQVLMRYRRVSGSLSSSPTRMYGQALEVFEKAGRTLTELTDADRQALREETAHYRAMLRLAEGKDALARNDFRAATEGLSEANVYFGSGKLKLILLLLRFAPKLLQGAYQLRNRYLLRSEARV
ncbi:MAG TPA: glycosyltransferase family A protein [Pyrinomonadaceae bacterium]|nr:glycosyltransferase family A protein [Pyrinomonadaceae bacterium]